jgi:hypothetical protein
MPRPIVHALASIPILALAGFVCGTPLSLTNTKDSFLSLLGNGAFGAWYCLITHGTEIFIATMIYCWLFYRRRAAK